MTPEHFAHLPEEAIHDLLIGLGSQESEAHLAACAACRNHLEEFQSRMLNFNEASLNWSHARAAALPFKPERPLGRILSSPLAWSLAAILLVAAALPVLKRIDPSLAGRISLPGFSANNSSSDNQADSPQPEDSETQIAQDNDLLRSVSVALNEDEESPLRAYHLAPGTTAHLKVRQGLGNR